jgi:DNA repair exonuclease SbcCD ATPase subunit
MITFKKIKWKNFLSTGNYFIEVDLNKTSNTLIVGENGSGKSTFLDAICFALFGKPFRKVNKSQLINSINGKDCEVEIEFEIGHKFYKIIRGIKPNKFEIYCNNELINQEASVKDYQNYLEKFVLKLNYKSFTQIVILGSASFTPFMQLESSDRRIIIEDLLDIQIFSTMNSIVKDKLVTNKDLIVDKKHSIELNQQKKKILIKHLEDLKKNNDEEISKYDQEIVTYNDNITNLLSENKSLNESAEKVQKDIENKIDVESKIKKLSKLESQIENNLSKIKTDIEFYENHDDCPTCRQSIPKDFRETQLVTLNDKTSEYKEGLSKLE